MASSSCGSLLMGVLVVVLMMEPLHAQWRLKTQTFLTPAITLEPGLSNERYYYNIDFPRGHIALKNFFAELVDEAGNPIPLSETYLHHWMTTRYYQRIGTDPAQAANNRNQQENGLRGLSAGPERIRAGNSGICDDAFHQQFGFGSETRRSSSYVPDPYGVEVGNPADVPEGYEEQWLMNIHAIDTRGTVDPFRCLECRCELYNVTVDEFGNPLPEGYLGGVHCCYNGMRCRLRDGQPDPALSRRNLYMRYTVGYLDWSDAIVPVQVFIIDVTDVWTRGDPSRGIRERNHCLIEYTVDACTSGELDCTHSRTLTASFERIHGDVVYALGHLHVGSRAIALYGEDGRELCLSTPVYGTGNEVGNEAGYVVGMTSCYPTPGSIRVLPGEALTVVSNYSSTTSHSGLMGLFTIFVAPDSSSTHLSSSSKVSDVVKRFDILNWGMAVFGFAVLAGVALSVFRGRAKGRADQTTPLAGDYKPV